MIPVVVATANTPPTPTPRSLPQLSRHPVLGDGQRRLGSDEVVAGVVTVSAHLTQDAGRAHAVEGAVQTSEAGGRGGTREQTKDSGSKSGGQPALVGAVRGEFVAAAAVGSVAEGSVGGGRTRLGAHNAAGGGGGGGGGFWVPVRRFVGATLAGEVAAHPLHHLFHHLVFELEKHVLDSGT